MDDLAFYLDPYTNKLAAMPIDMLNTYVPDMGMPLQDAAQCAAIRDQEEATNLILSIEDADETTAQLSTVAR